MTEYGPHLYLPIYCFMKNFLRYILPVLLLSLLFSCVKDTDFDQLQEVVLSPNIEVNLLFFEINSNEFIDPATGIARPVLSDVTDIPFLDDSDTQEGILKADFLYEFENTTSIDYQATISFKSGASSVMYALDILVPAGSIGNPQTHVVIDEIDVPEIYQITQANKISVSIDPMGQLPTDGSLKMRSKATFYFEIDGQ